MNKNKGCVMSKVCEPFEYENLKRRSLVDFLTVDAPFAFEKKQLKHLRPFLQAIPAKKLLSDPKRKAKIAALFKQHLGSPTSLNKNKWSTLGSEMALRGDVDLLEMWISARPDGWEIVSNTPSDATLYRLTTKLIPHLIKSPNPPLLEKIIRGWTSEEKTKIAQMCGDLHELPQFGINLLAFLGGPVQNQRKGDVPNFTISSEISEIYPEYFLAQLKKNLEDFVRGEDLVEGMKSVFPSSLLAQLKAENENDELPGLHLAFQHLKALPTQWQDQWLQEIKGTPYAQKICEASPQIKAFVEKKEIEAALGSMRPSATRHSKM